MITTQTFVENDTQVSVRKIDVTTDGSGSVVALSFTDLNGVVEIQIQPETKAPRFNRKQLSDDDRKNILLPGYKNHKSQWTPELDQQLLALSHLFRALDAELALQRSLSVYRGKAKHEDAVCLIRRAAHSDAPTSGTCL